MTEVVIFYFGNIFVIFVNMKDESHLKNLKSVFLIPVAYVVVIWLLYWIEIYFNFNFNKYGVLPRDLIGLRGIIFTHFIHNDTNHLFNNSIPLFVLLLSVFYFYRDIAYKVLIFGGLLSGFLTWVIARESYHIGASGIVYLLFSFVFFSGIIRKHYRLVALSFIIIFLYGSMIWYVLPIKDGMSWEGHLSGLLIGLVFAVFYRKKGLVKKEYEFSKTSFDLLFDENGDFAPPEIEEEQEEERK
jgi:membrane associated rhomboid family serine protease